MTLQDKIQTLRRTKGLSQEDVADALDVSRQAVSKWETGLSNPSTENLIALAKLFESSADELLDLAQGERPVSASDSAAPQAGTQPSEAEDGGPAAPGESEIENGETAGTAERNPAAASATGQAEDATKAPLLQKLWTGVKYALAVAAIAVLAIVVFGFLTGTWDRNGSSQPVSPLVSEPPARRLTATYPQPAATRRPLKRSCAPGLSRSIAAPMYPPRPR